MIEFEGVVHNVERRFKETTSDYVREQMEKYMAQQDCPSCKGYRLKPETLAVKIADKHIGEVTKYSIQDADTFFKELDLSEKDMQIARLVLREIEERLGFFSQCRFGLFNVKSCRWNTFWWGSTTNSSSDANRLSFNGRALYIG